ncbi:MAG: T9SS type A sorting domain-containing protein [Crocinitomicaceae bacterium]|nr:T9SS type A sorting domain-containing protein [Crocinitomicaceae bacterium]
MDQSCGSSGMMIAPKSTNTSQQVNTSERNLGVRDDSIISFNVWPNPLEDNVFISSPVGQTIKILTLNGELIKSIRIDKGVNNVDLGFITRGVYLIQTEDQLENYKLIKL